MTEKHESDYLKEATRHIKKIYKKLGHSPTAAEYDRNSESKFKLRALYKNNIKLNQLKETAGVPIRKSGSKVGKQKGDRRPDIFCLIYNGKMPATDCLPGYKKNICKNCESIQKDNINAIPDIPKEIEKILKYDEPLGSKYMNGNDVYLTDVGIK